MKKLIPANNYCPCGSRLKYKKCCLPKGIDFFIAGKGKVKGEAPMTAERRAAFQEEVRRFTLEHGRAPTEEEEGVLRYSEFEEIEQVIQRELKKSGASAETIYAFEKTGILVSDEDNSQVSADELQRWSEAIQEYRQLKKEGKV